MAVLQRNHNNPRHRRDPRGIRVLPKLHRFFGQIGWAIRHRAGLAAYLVAFVATGVISLSPVSDRGGSAALTGRASIIDGDTLDIQGRRVRLFGIDAPESAQTCVDGRGQSYRCGQRATQALWGKIGGRTVECEGRDVDRYGRTVAVCRVGAEDINAAMVREGWAVAYLQFSRSYLWAELQARASGRGLWSGDFLRPADWRRSHG
jgi:endonuclease YncB( thermonuclease family)